MKPVFYRLSIMLAVLVFIMPPAHANDIISAESFNEYAQAAGFEKQYHQMINIFISNFQNGMIQGFENGISQKQIPPDLRQKISVVLNESANNLRVNFEQLFKNEVKFQELISDLYLPIYRKHFSRQELNELLSFYKSPVGKKLSDLTPAIMQESSTAFNKMYGFRVQKLGGELVKKELDSLTEKVKALEAKH